MGKKENTPVFPTPHNFPSEALQELPQCGVLRPVFEGTVPYMSQVASAKKMEE
jgi:hypothetical protein